MTGTSVDGREESTPYAAGRKERRFDPLAVIGSKDCPSGFREHAPSVSDMRMKTVMSPFFAGGKVNRMSSDVMDHEYSAFNAESDS
jgi:hypothetical protein